LATNPTSTPYWHYRSPDEADLLPAVSAEILMGHARLMAAREKESGTPGEAQSYDHIEQALKSYGYAVERREIEAFISLPQEGLVALPDGSVIEGLTHAFSPSTDGLEAEVVDVGDGNPADLARGAGKIALHDSLATPGKAWAAQQAGTVGQIFVNRDHLHNMIVTTIWGTPEPETAWRIPRTPCLSVRRGDGDRIRQLIREGRGRVRLITRVRTAWAPIPHLTAHLDGTAEDRFIMFSGHVDGWHFGAMDNGTANATMLEVARLLASRRRALRRGLRLAFWSGHSHGRYAGSTWYADHAWMELHRRCAVHLNIDSTGARGATDYSVVHATEDAQSFVEQVVHDVTGQAPQARRFPRAGDQSFWGIGIPSALMSLSGIPKQDTDLSRWMERLFGTAGFPWWWHTREDTIDKIDSDILALDTRVYVAAALRLVGGPVLPLDYLRFARAIVATVEELGAAGRWDAAPALAAARHLSERAARFTRAVGDAVSGHGDAARAEAANRALVGVSRVLIPLFYTTGDRFHHDLAIPVPPLAGLQRARELSGLDPSSDGFRFAAAALLRERNRVVHALEAAAGIMDVYAP
jgi:N-acetylated-alpha-linked acidic dipeptidase